MATSSLGAQSILARLGVLDRPAVLLPLGFPRSHLAKAFDCLARTEVLELEEGTDLALALSAETQRGVNLYEALGPFDRLGLRRELEDRIAGDQLFRFRERSIGHHALTSREPHPRALRARLQPIAREEYAGLAAFLQERSHGPEGLLAREDARLRVLVGLDNAHVPDRSGLPRGRGGAELLLPFPQTSGLLRGIDREVGQ